MVEHQPSKLDTWVRFPSPAFVMRKKKNLKWLMKRPERFFFGIKKYPVNSVLESEKTVAEGLWKKNNPEKKTKSL